jgi:Tol biopolymer transport system component
MAQHAWEKKHELRHPLPVTDILWSPAGDKVIVTCRSTAGETSEEFSDQCFVWNLATERCEFSFPNHDCQPLWSPDGRYIARTKANGTGVLLAADTGEVVYTFGLTTRYRVSEALVWHPSGGQFAAFGKHEVWDDDGDDKVFHSNSWILFDVESQSPLFRVEGGFRGWDASGTKFATQESGCIVLWDAVNLQETDVIDGDVLEGWSPDGRQVVTMTSGDEPATMLWDTESGECLARCSLDTYTCTWSGDSSRVLVSGKGQPSDRFTYYVWNSRTGATIFEHASRYPEDGGLSYMSPGCGAGLSPDGTKLACYECWCFWDSTETADAGLGDQEIEDDDRVYIHDLETGVQQHLFDDCNASTWSPDGTMIATCEGYSDHSINVRRVTTGEDVRRIATSSFETWSPGNRLTGFPSDGDSVFEIWDPWEGVMLAQIPTGPKPGQLREVAWNSNGELVGLDVGNGTVEVWSESD